VAQIPAEPSIVIVAATMPIHHSTVTDTPASGCHRHCLFVEEFIICGARGQSNYVSDDSFRVPRALADTGAGPSVITTELLLSLPIDASAIRDYDETNTNVCGPDGRALTTAGHATIVFTLVGLACRHRFLVVEGSSMVLLGNDFLHSRGDTINLSISGPCSMTLLAGEDDRKAHNVPVTTIPPGEERPMALTLSEEPKALAPTTKTETSLPPLERPDFSTPIQPLDFNSDPSQPRVSTDGQQVNIDPIPEPPDPNTPNTNGNPPRLCSEECLLSTHEAVRIPKRCKATFLIKLPETFQSHLDSAVLVDRLLNREGLEDPPLVEMRVETPTPKGSVYVTVWNTSDMNVTLPSFSAVALASIKCKIHEAKSKGSDPSDPLSSLSEAEKILLNSVQLDPDNQLNPTQLERVRQLLSRRIKAFALDPKSPGVLIWTVSDKFQSPQTPI